MTSRDLCERKCEKRSKSVRQRVRGVADGLRMCQAGCRVDSVTHDANGGLSVRSSCNHRHGVSVKKGVKRGSVVKFRLSQDLLIAAVGSGGQGESIL